MVIRIRLFWLFSCYRCDCRTAEGRLLEGIRTEMLETVIPRYSKTRIIVTCKGVGWGGGGQILKSGGDHFVRSLLPAISSHPPFEQFLLVFCPLIEPNAVFPIFESLLVYTVQCCGTASCWCRSVSGSYFPFWILIKIRIQIRILPQVLLSWKKWSLTLHMIEKCIRIRIRQNDAEATGSGSTTFFDTCCCRWRFVIYWGIMFPF